MFIISNLLLPFLICAILIPFLKIFSEKKKLLDVAEGDPLKIHEKPISYLGGLAMLIACIIAFFFNPRSLSIGIGSLIIFAIGFWDDLKWKHILSIKPFLKFPLLLIFALMPALMLYSAGVSIGTYWLLSIFLSFLIIFVMMNAINYQDGMDGQAGSLSFISFIGFFVLSILSSSGLGLVLSLTFIGVVLGFLVFNLPKAKVFMGDSGAYLLGFYLSVLAIIFFANHTLSVLLILGLPLFDGAFTNLRRVLKGKSIFLGDREHIYDKMLDKGFSVKKTLLISCAIQGLCIAIGILLY